jgi:hypothetical protein
VVPVTFIPVAAAPVAAPPKTALAAEAHATLVAVEPPVATASILEAQPHIVPEPGFPIAPEPTQPWWKTSNSPLVHAPAIHAAVDESPAVAVASHPAAAQPITHAHPEPAAGPRPETDTDIRIAAGTAPDPRSVRSSIRSSARPSIFDDEFFRSPIPRRGEEHTEERTEASAVAASDIAERAAAPAIFNSPVFRASARQTLAAEAAADFQPLPPQLRPSFNANRVYETGRETVREVVRETVRETGRDPLRDSGRETDRAVSNPHTPAFAATHPDPGDADELDIPAFLRRGI